LGGSCGHVVFVVVALPTYQCEEIILRWRKKCKFRLADSHLCNTSFYYANWLRFSSMDGGRDLVDITGLALGGMKLGGAI
jgi:hypothetical protein